MKFKLVLVLFCCSYILNAQQIDLQPFQLRSDAQALKSSLELKGSVRKLKGKRTDHYYSPNNVMPYAQEYDRLGRLISENTNMEHCNYQYFNIPEGLKVEVKSSKKILRTEFYNSDGQQLSSVSAYDSTVYHYDSNGNELERLSYESSTFGFSNEKSLRSKALFNYDQKNRLIKAQYFGSVKRRGVEDLFSEEHYVYKDSLDVFIVERYNSYSNTSYFRRDVYDMNGYLIQCKDDENLEEMDYTYDLQGNLTTIKNKFHTITLVYTYDAHNNWIKRLIYTQEYNHTPKLIDTNERQIEYYE